MTEPTEFDLLTLATPYALHAVTDGERADIERQASAAAGATAAAFRDEVRAVREAMALVSAATALEPPAALRERLLAAVALQARRRRRWRTTGFVAAAVAAAVIAFGAGVILRPTATPPTAEQVFTASDVRTASDVIAAGGTATVVYSRTQDAAVLVLNNVHPPAEGTVYQMWLIEGATPRSAGTMSTPAVRPSTTQVIRGLGQASVLAFTVEPGTGSPQPTGQIFIKLPLS